MSSPRALLVALALAGGLPVAARAQCTFVTGPTALAFGAYDPGSAVPDDSTGTFQFNCPNSSYRPVVSLSAGAGTFTQRYMSLGSDQLLYNLYQDAARTVIWGDGTPPSQTLAGTRRGTTYTIYGRIPTGQWVPAGTYTDTITVTLQY